MWNKFHLQFVDYSFPNVGLFNFSKLIFSFQCLHLIGNSAFVCIQFQFVSPLNLNCKCEQRQHFMNSKFNFSLRPIQFETKILSSKISKLNLVSALNCFFFRYKYLNDGFCVYLESKRWFWVESVSRRCHSAVSVVSQHKMCLMS